MKARDRGNKIHFVASLVTIEINNNDEDLKLSHANLFSKVCEYLLQRVGSPGLYKPLLYTQRMSQESRVILDPESKLEWIFSEGMIYGFFVALVILILRLGGDWSKTVWWALMAALVGSIFLAMGSFFEEYYVLDLEAKILEQNRRFGPWRWTKKAARFDEVDRIGIHAKYLQGSSEHSRGPTRKWRYGVALLDRNGQLHIVKNRFQEFDQVISEAERVSELLGGVPVRQNGPEKILRVERGGSGNYRIKYVPRNVKREFLVSLALFFLIIVAWFLITSY